MTQQRARRLGVAVAAMTLAVAGPVLVPTTTTAGAQVAVPSKPAIFDAGTWYLRDSLTSGAATSTFNYGRNGDIPVMGDWDGDGDDTVGVVRFQEFASGEFRYVWHLRNSNSGGPADVTPFVYGRVRFVAVDQLGTIPVVGDWDGDGDDTPGVMLYDFDPGGTMQWHLRNSSTSGVADHVATYSRGRDVPVVGDWDGDGDDTLGVYRFEDNWLLSNDIDGGVADIAFRYGGDPFLELPVPGDWDGNGTYTPAVLRNSPPTEAEGGFEQWLFRNSNSAGPGGQIVFGSDAQTVFLPIDTISRLSWK